VIGIVKLVHSDYSLKEGEYFPWTWYEPLFDYMSTEHNVTLLQGELDELIEIVSEMLNNRK